MNTKTFSESHAGKPSAGLVREDVKAAVKTFDASVSCAFQAARSSLGVIITVVGKGDSAINRAEIEAVETWGGGQEESQTLCETSRCAVRVDKHSRTVCDFGDANNCKMENGLVTHSLEMRSACVAWTSSRRPSAAKRSPSVGCQQMRTATDDCWVIAIPSSVNASGRPTSERDCWIAADRRGELATPLGIGTARLHTQRGAAGAAAKPSLVTARWAAAVNLGRCGCR
jgi:hypothetical protein